MVGGGSKKGGKTSSRGDDRGRVPDSGMVVSGTRGFRGFWRGGCYCRSVSEKSRVADAPKSVKEEILWAAARIDAVRISKRTDFPRRGKDFLRSNQKSHSRSTSEKSLSLALRNPLCWKSIFALFRQFY